MRLNDDDELRWQSHGHKSQQMQYESFNSIYLGYRGRAVSLEWLVLWWDKYERKHWVMMRFCGEILLRHKAVTVICNPVVQSYCCPQPPALKWGKKDKERTIAAAKLRYWRRATRTKTNGGDLNSFAPNHKTHKLHRVGWWLACILWFTCFVDENFAWLLIRMPYQKPGWSVTNTSIISTQPSPLICSIYQHTRTKWKQLWRISLPCSIHS